jgi:hypothetical protein
MPTFVRISAHEGNLGGITSKGYWIYKRRLVVSIKWGAIKSISRKFYWAGENLPQTKVTEFESADEALRYYNDKLRRIRNEQYSLLPKGKNILKNKS